MYCAQLSPARDETVKQAPRETRVAKQACFGWNSPIMSMWCVHELRGLSRQNVKYFN
jgi:hypothetical protein